MATDHLHSRKLRLTFSAMLTVLAACQDPAVSLGPVDRAGTLTEAVARRGFRTEGMREVGEYVVVEGDIALRKADLLRASTTRTTSPDTSSKLHPGPANRQWMVDTILSQVNAANITVDLGAISSDPGWAAAMRAAMGAWNAVPGTDLYFTEASPGDITVQFSNLSGDGIAQADFPLGATQKPGRNLYISPSYGYLSALQKLFVLVHELGHSIGFRHTNWQSYYCNGVTRYEPQYGGGANGANQVYGTPATDSYSVMNACTGGTTFSGFSHYDSVAVMTKYHTVTLTESTNGTHPVVTVRYPRGAVSAVLQLAVSVTELDDNWATTYSERDENIGWPSASGDQIEDAYHPWGYNNCSQDYDWPYEQDKAYYSLHVTYPQGTIFNYIDAHALDYTGISGWSCWNG